MKYCFKRLTVMDIYESLAFYISECYLLRAELDKLKLKVTLSDCATQTSTDSDEIEVNCHPSVADMILETCSTAVASSGYSYDERSGLYLHEASGYYYDPENKLFYEPKSGFYLMYNADTGQYNVVNVENKTELMKNYESSFIRHGLQHLDNSTPATSKEVCRIVQLLNGTVHISTKTMPLMFHLDSNKSICISPLPSDDCDDYFTIIYNDELQSFQLKCSSDVKTLLVNGSTVCLNNSEARNILLRHEQRFCVDEEIFICHMHRGSYTCDECEPGAVRQRLNSIQGQWEIERKELLPVETSTKTDVSNQRRMVLNALKRKYALNAAADVASSGVTYKNQQSERKGEFDVDVPTFYDDYLPSHNTFNFIDVDNIGRRMLMSMGWKEGTGLGKNEDGIKEPVAAMKPSTMSQSKKCRTLAIMRKRFHGISPL